MAVFDRVEGKRREEATNILAYACSEYDTGVSCRTWLEKRVKEELALQICRSEHRKTIRGGILFSGWGHDT